MAKVDEIRNHLIDKILTITNEDYLKALDHLISADKNSDENVKLSREQKLMIQMSLEEVEKGQTVAEEEVQYKTQEWLKKKNA